MEGKIEFIDIPLSKISLNKGQIDGVPANPRQWTQEDVDRLARSIEETPELIEARGPLVVQHGSRYVALGGNLRMTAAKQLQLKTLRCAVLPADTPAETLRAVSIKDNGSFGAWDYDALANEWDDLPLTDWGVPTWETSGAEGIGNGAPGWDDGGRPNTGVHGSLAARFVAPPFSVLDSRQGYWMERKKMWRALIGDYGESRENTLWGGGLFPTKRTEIEGDSGMEKDVMANNNNGVSLLDPVLVECIVRWFGIDGGKAFNPFAGDAVFGYIAASLGMSFTGIEIRDEQVRIDKEKVAGLPCLARYICDDGQNVAAHVPADSQDLLFSCPPYYDLEHYSDLPNDASNQETYEDFLAILRNAFSAAIRCLKDNRFAVIVCGDIRDDKGRFYRGFPDDIKRIFADGGMHLYNELILVEPLGTLPQRVGRYMRGRKVGKCHQNVLVFYKGDDPANIKNDFKELDFTVEDIESFNNAQ